MSIPSVLDSEIISCSDVIKAFDVVLSSNPFLSIEPVESPPVYNTHHSSVNSCNSGTLSGHPGHSNPVLMATFCNSNCPNDGQSQGAVPANKRKHKMIERQRRKDMNALLSILRSLIPAENLQGKRSVSDQVQEAVNYVQHLQQNVEDLSIERDKMKPSSDNNAKDSFQGVRLSCNDQFCIKASPIRGSDWEFPTVKVKSMGSAFQVWTNTFEHQIVYSDLLMALEDGGLEVVCAASSAINNRVYHTIHTKVSDLHIFNIDTLHQKLWHLIRTNKTQHQDTHTVEARA